MPLNSVKAFIEDNGNINILFTDSADGGALRYISSDNCGSSWNSVGTITDSLGKDISLSVYSIIAIKSDNGRIAVAWAVNDGSCLKVATHNGSDWDIPGASECAIEPSQGNVMSQNAVTELPISIAINNNGNMILVWEERLDSAGLEVFFKGAFFQNGQWSDPQLLLRNVPNPNI